MALVSGLMAAGCRVHDIGLAVTPMAYFAQFDLDVPCVAMVTASHNDNGWTGVKMGANRPLTFGPDEMTRLKDIVLNARFDLRGGGAYAFVENFPARYIADLTNRPKLERRLKVVCACGNGTAGAFAPKVLAAVGCEVVPLDCELDHTFPHYNPNTEDMKMLHAMRDEVLREQGGCGARLRRRWRPLRRRRQRGRGDLRRQGRRDAGARHLGAAQGRDLRRRREVDRPVHDRSGAAQARRQDRLLEDRPLLHEAPGQRDRRARGLREVRHFFFNKPLGRGYDDGLIFALAVCDMLDRNPGKSMADLKNALPKTWSSPTMSPHCADEIKYRVVDDVVKHFEAAKAKGEKVAGQPIRDVVTVNGVRVTVEDGTWGLVRASSNKPELVVVVESPVSEARMRDMFKEIDAVLRTHPEVGEYNQTI